MENSKNITNWSQISYPVYKIPTGHNIKRDGTVLYSFLEYREEETGDIVSVLRILDDTSVSGSTLGLRRAYLASQDVQLLRLRTSIFFLADLIKLATPSTLFIDSNGSLFRYTKSRTVKLIFKRIIKKIPIPNGIGTILEIEGVSSRYKTMQRVTNIDDYAGLLDLGGHYILYGTYPEMLPITYRKV